MKRVRAKIRGNYSKSEKRRLSIVASYLQGIDGREMPVKRGSIARKGVIAIGRARKSGVDYFSHDTTACSGKTIFTLEAKFGNDGYASWFKLLEILGTQDGHYYNCNEPADWLFLVAKTRVDEISATEILDTLAKVGAIDAQLWAIGVIWSENYVRRLSDVYRKRGVKSPERPKKDDFCDRNTGSAEQSAAESTQSKAKYSEVKHNKDASAPKEVIVANINFSAGGKEVPSSTRDVTPSGSVNAVSQPSCNAEDESGVPSPTDMPLSGSASAVLQAIEEEFELKTKARKQLLWDYYTKWSRIFDEESIKMALSEAIKNNARTLPYIDAVLCDWNKAGVRKIEDVGAHLADFQSRKRKKPATQRTKSADNFTSTQRDLSWMEE